MVVSNWGQTSLDSLDFAVVTLGEYVVYDLTSCPLVVEGFTVRAQKAKKAPYLWSMADKVFSTSYSLRQKDKVHYFSDTKQVGYSNFVHCISASTESVVI